MKNQRKQSHLQLNNLKNALKNQAGATLRMSIKMFNGNNLPHELLLSTIQTTNLSNTIKSYVSTDKKLYKTQIS